LPRRTQGPKSSTADRCESDCRYPALWTVLRDLPRYRSRKRVSNAARKGGIPGPPQLATDGVEDDAEASPTGRLIMVSLDEHAVMEATLSTQQMWTIALFRSIWTSSAGRRSVAEPKELKTGAARTACRPCAQRGPPCEVPDRRDQAIRRQAAALIVNPPVVVRSLLLPGSVLSRPTASTASF